MIDINCPIFTFKTLNNKIRFPRVSQAWSWPRRGGIGRRQRDENEGLAEGNPLKIQITYRNYFCPATAEDLRRGNKLAHWRRTWRHKSRRTYERPFININKPYVSVGHNDTIVARSIPTGFSRVLMRNDESNESRASYAAREGEYRRRGTLRSVPQPRGWYYFVSPRDARRHTRSPCDRSVTVNVWPAAKSAGMSRGGAFPLINLIRLALARRFIITKRNH